MARTPGGLGSHPERDKLLLRDPGRCDQWSTARGSGAVDRRGHCFSRLPLASNSSDREDDDIDTDKVVFKQVSPAVCRQGLLHQLLGTGTAHSQSLLEFCCQTL